MPHNDSGVFSNDEMTPGPCRKKIKMEEVECGSGSSTDQDNASTRPNTAEITFQYPKKLKIHVKLFGEDQRFDTDGRENIVSMVERYLKEAECGKKKPKIENLLFKSTSDDSYLNLGLPTGALSKGENFECIFGEKLTMNMIRHYSVEEVEESCNMASFNVKFEKNKHFLVSDMQRIVDVLRVDFFPGETLFQALCRDGRFTYRDAVCKTDFEAKDGSKVYLTSEATNDTFKLTKRRHPNEKLTSQELPLRKPIGKIAGTIKQEHGTPTTLYSKTPLVAHGRKNKKLHLQEYFENTYGLMLEKEKDEEREEQRKKGIEKFAHKHYTNFALNYEHRVFVSDLEQTLKLINSIGAVIGVNGNKDHMYGTCFRIGEQFVITNCHVLTLIEDDGFKLDHVDFGYKEKDGYSIRFDSESVLVLSHELDYVILKLHLDDKTSLPQNVTELGYSIASPDFQLPTKECLTLIGHPGGMEKQINVSCPLKRQDIKQELVMTLQRMSPQDLKTHERSYFQAAFSPDSIPYDVSTFFEGSSGSPGLLMSQKKLISLHCSGVEFPGITQRFAVEEGTLMSSIVKDVQSQKENGQTNLQNTTLSDIFGLLEWL